MCSGFFDAPFFFFSILIGLWGFCSFFTFFGVCILTLFLNKIKIDTVKTFSPIALRI